MPPKFHGSTIDNHDWKFFDCLDIGISFFGNVTMNKIMGVTTVNEDDDILMINVINELEGVGSRESSESIQGNDWFNFWGV